LKALDINKRPKVNVDGRYEDCEHRAFHIQARQNSGAKIMISPEVLFH